MPTEFKVADLVPVSEWIFSLYAIRYMDKEGGETLKIDSCVSHSATVEEFAEYAPPRCEWIEWYHIADVPSPQQIGQIHGFPIHESGWSAARRYDRF